MATAPKKGLNPARKVGSGPDNKGLSSYAIASGYSTLISTGDPVRLTTDGTIIKGTNAAGNIGVFAGVSYTNSLGEVKFSQFWPASTVATNIEALVIDDPFATFQAVADAAVGSVATGALYPLTLTAGTNGQSNAVVNVSGGVVTIGSSAVKVIKVLDVDNRVLEVVLSSSALRDNG